MNISKVKYMIKLQEEINLQIEQLGQADSVMANELEWLVDSLTDEEGDLVLQMWEELQNNVL